MGANNGINCNNQGGHRAAAPMPTQEMRRKEQIRRQERRCVLHRKYQVTDHVLEALLVVAVKGGGEDLDARRFIMLHFGVNGRICVRYPDLRFELDATTIDQVKQVEVRALLLIDQTYHRLKGDT